MRIFIVIDETVFFHPQFINQFLEKTQDEVVGACLVTGIKKKNNIERYMITHFYYLRLEEMWKMGTKQIKYSLMDKLDKKRKGTVKSVFEMFQIDYREVKYCINTEENLQYIESCKPDVIISSQSLYFGKRLLNIPSKCCINRHSGLLPRNGGLWPGFQAIRKGEKETGVSVHTMTSNIDDGIVLTQKRVKIQENDTMWNIYRQCFAESAEAILEALNKIRNGDYTPINNEFEAEYYSFPTKEQWKEFRAHSGRYI